MEEALAQDADRVAAASNALTQDAAAARVAAASNALAYYEQLRGNSNLPTSEVTIWISTPSTPKAACPTNPAWSLALNLAGVWEAGK